MIAGHEEVRDLMTHVHVAEYLAAEQIDGYDQAGAQPDVHQVRRNRDRPCQATEAGGGHGVLDEGSRRIGDLDDLQSTVVVSHDDLARAGGHPQGGAVGVHLGDDLRTEGVEHVEHADAGDSVRDDRQIVGRADVVGVTWGVSGGDQAGAGRHPVEGIRAILDLGTVLDTVAIRVLIARVSTHDVLTDVRQAILVGVVRIRRAQEEVRHLEGLAAARSRQFDGSDLQARRLQQPDPVLGVRREDEVAECHPGSTCRPPLLDPFGRTVFYRVVMKACLRHLCG